METKICRLCGEEKPISDFPKHNQYLDGYDTRCKCCVNAYHKVRCHKPKKRGGGILT